MNLLVVPWLLPYLTLLRLARPTPRLSSVTPVRGPRVSVIVPARNEELSIATVVQSVLASDYPNLELIVVDDRSTDGTAAIVRDLAAGDPRCRVLSGTEPLSEWYGKPWACVQGYRAATGDILLFTDADTRHSPTLLAYAVGALEAEGADLVTVAPRQLSITFWERLVMPQVWWLLAVRFHPRLVNRAKRVSDVIANGQFILVRREAYEAIGTHAAVHDQVAEDLALAQVFFRAGRKLHFAFAEELMETRMYHDLRQIIEGWSKNIYLGSRRSFPDNRLMQVLSPLLLTLTLLLWIVPPVGLTLWYSGALPASSHDILVEATALSLVFWAIILAGMRIPPWYALGYPLGAAMTLYIVIRSTLRGGKRVEWKGRMYGRIGD